MTASDEDFTHDILIPLTFRDLIHPTEQTLKILWESWPDDMDTAQDHLTASQTSKNMAQLLDARQPSPPDPGITKSEILSEAWYARSRRHLLMYLFRAVRDTYGVDYVPYALEILVGGVESGIEYHVEIAQRTLGKAEEALNEDDDVRSLLLCVKALAQLCPFSSDRSIMSKDEAASVGLSQIELDIHRHLVILSVKLDMTGKMYLDDLGSLLRDMHMST